MKKQIVLALAISVSALSFAQKKELKAAEKAIKSNNFSEAKTLLTQVEPLLGSLDEKTKTKYQYLKGVALYSNGTATNKDQDEALGIFNQIKSGYKTEIALLKDKMVNDYLSKGNKAYESKNFGLASTNFERVYNLRSQDTTYLYYAAATAVNVPDYERALPLYEKLKDLNYTGIEENFFAVNTKTNVNEKYPSKTLRDAAVKAKSAKNPTSEKTTSKRAEIVKNVALIYISNGDKDKAIKAIQDARAIAPNDVNLIISEANIYHEMGDVQKFKELLEMATLKEPNNPELQYNLGVISADSKDFESAKKYYAKAIELDPNYVNAYINCSAVILGGESAIIEEMNGLGSSSADNRRYDELLAKRQGIYKEAVPFLSKAIEIDPKNENATATLMNIYSVLGDTKKYKELKAIVETLKAGN